MKNSFNKRSIVSALFALLVCIVPMDAHNAGFDAKKYPNFAKFADRYACPQDIKEKVETIEESSFYEGDNFYLKGSGIDRLINALRAQRIIDKHNLGNIAVAEKCLCQNAFQDFVVAARRVTSTSGRRLSLKDTQDLITFVEETGFRDWVALDLINDHKNNRLTFIDTEDSSFFVGMIHGNEKANIPQHCKLVYLACLAKSLGQFMEDDAVDFLNQRYNELKHSPEGKQPHTPIFNNTKYDDKDIDFEKVKTEFQEFLSDKK